MAADILRFPPGFVFGGATSSFQIEGATSADGRTPSIWDRFCATPGTILDGSNGDIACDHYHRYAEDVALMRDLGFGGYRFSIAWPRVISEEGQINQAGLDFYDRLVDTLLAAGITPFATLYHWDLPLWLEDQGGWRVRKSVPAFVEFADVVSRRLGDRVKQWMTHNEPWCASFLSHLIGAHAPGEQDAATAIQVAHHLLLSHGAAVPVLRTNSPAAQVGIALNFEPARPTSNSETDLAAARRYDGFYNRWFLEPVLGRGYPQDMVELYGPLMPEIADGDMQQIAVPIDFLGVNFYHDTEIGAGTENTLINTRALPPRDENVTSMDWAITPDALEQLLLRLHREYQVPKLYITENGCAYRDTIGPDGRVDDQLRVTFLQQHFAAAARALAGGAPLAGFFAWSLLDNFEWAFGYTERFGIVYTDYATQQRIPKASALWYRDLIAAQ